MPSPTLSIDTTFKCVNNISVPVLRPPVVETILPHFGERDKTTQVMLTGQRLGIAQADIISITAGGQPCRFLHLHASADSPPVIFCEIPPAKPEAPVPAIYDVIVTTKSGGIGSCERRWTYVQPEPLPSLSLSSSSSVFSSSRSGPRAAPPVATNPTLPRARNQVQLKKCTVFLQSMLNSQGYIMFSRMVGDDTHPRVHEALVEILQSQVVAAKTRYVERVAGAPADDDPEPEPVRLVRCITVDNITQQAPGSSLSPFICSLVCFPAFTFLALCLSGYCVPMSV